MYDLKVSVPFMEEPAAELVLVAEGAMMKDRLTVRSLLMAMYDELSIWINPVVDGQFIWD